jgi:hypothetical protein
MQTTPTTTTQRAATFADYRARRNERDRIIRENASRRMRTHKLPALAVPAKLNPPLVRVAYDLTDGSYCGVIEWPEDGEGYRVELEPARREFPCHWYVIDATTEKGAN